MFPSHDNRGAYAKSLQDFRKYLYRLEGPQGGSEANFMNISWDNTMLFPKFMELAKSTVGGVSHEPEVKAYDTIAAYRKQMQKNRDTLASMPQAKQLFAEIGRAPQGITPSVAGTSPQNVDIYERLGGYMLSEEVATRDAIKASLDLSRYNELWDLFVDDLLEVLS